jgi:hypothetical protein
MTTYGSQKLGRRSKVSGKECLGATVLNDVKIYVQNYEIVHVESD